MISNDICLGPVRCNNPSAIVWQRFALDHYLVNAKVKKIWINSQGLIGKSLQSHGIGWDSRGGVKEASSELQLRMHLLTKDNN